jgi:hypothetical protein
MAVAEIQKALARLFTDKAAREAFLADPQSAAAILGLEEADAALMSTVAPKELRRFSASLASKRVLDARKWTPLVAEALGPRFGPLFAALPDSRDPVRQTEAFAAYLATLARPGKIEPVWIGDLARYEAACVAAGRPRFIFRLRFFRYPIGEIAISLARGAPVGELGTRLSIGLWFRSPGGRLLAYLWTHNSPLSRRERGRG